MKNIKIIGRTERKKSQSGFTLIELLITLTVVGIIASFSVPMFTEFLAEQRVDSNLRSFVSSVKFTQSEAAKGNTTVTMCIAGSVVNTCDTGLSPLWNQGWHIFTNPNNDLVIDIGTGDTLLRTQAPIPGMSIFSALPTQRNINFIGTGQITNFANAGFTLCEYDVNNLDCTDSGEYNSALVALSSGQILIP